MGSEENLNSGALTHKSVIDTRDRHCNYLVSHDFTWESAKDSMVNILLQGIRIIAQ